MRGKPFQAGQSGNPRGKTRGTRNRTTLALEKLLDGEAQALTRTAIELAKGGDTVALRMCLDRLMPVRKDRPITFDLPAVETAADATKATAALMWGVATGEITPSEAGELAKVVDSHMKAITTTDLDARLSALEQAAGAKR